MENNKTYDISEIFVYLWNKRRFLITAIILGAIASVIISLLMPNQYKAETYLFPTSFISPSTMNSHINQKLIR